jgi:hypothetical protein
MSQICNILGSPGDARGEQSKADHSELEFAVRLSLALSLAAAPPIRAISKRLSAVRLCARAKAADLASSERRSGVNVSLFAFAMTASRVFLAILERRSWFLSIGF